MGLSLSLLTAVCLLLPGATFVFGLSKLDARHMPGRMLDPHLSAALALLVLAAVLAQALWLSAWQGVTHFMAWPMPDPRQVIVLLSGNLSGAVGLQAMESLSRYPLRICAYFIALPTTTWGLGRACNRFLRRQPAANWQELLSPASAQLVWMSVDLHLGGRCYVFAGPVSDFSIARDGTLERVVLSYAIRRSSERRRAVSERIRRAGMQRSQVEAGRAVLLLREAHAIKLDYLVRDERPAVR